VISAKCAIAVVNIQINRSLTQKLFQLSSGAFARENWNHKHLMVRDMLRLVLGEALG
jgi:hypothetical protein